MGWTDKLQSTLGASVQEKIQANWPMIKQQFQDKLGNDLRNHLADPEKAVAASKMVYSVLPMPVRLIVKEEVFVQFCLQHKDELL
jgi:hypothetical protein